MPQYVTPHPRFSAWGPSNLPTVEQVRSGALDSVLNELADTIKDSTDKSISAAAREGRGSGGLLASEQRELDKLKALADAVIDRSDVVMQDFEDRQAQRERREQAAAKVYDRLGTSGTHMSASSASRVGREIAEGVEHVLAGRGTTATVDLEIRNTATEGGDFGQGVPIQFGPVQRTLRARSVVMGLPGVRQVPMDSDKLRFPRIDESDADTAAENSTLTATDPDLDSVTLTAKKYFVYTELSTELEEDFSADALDVIGQNMLDGLARKVDADMLGGTGAGGVVGIRNWPGINTTSVAAVPTSFAKLKEVEYELDAANADLGSAAWVMHPRSWYTLGLIKTGISGDETTLLNPNPQTAARSLLGYSVRTSSQITLTEGAGAGSWVGLVDGSQLVIGVRRAPRVEISRDVAFDRDVIALRATCRYGFAVINPGAVSIATDVRAS
ncbi:phage major capsid protein [Actinomarinicola tropica]|nr:phage major capsid protein [Actinomarinicola tropica]